MTPTNVQSWPLRSAFTSSVGCPLAERTVGVVNRDDIRSEMGYNLFSNGKETYLINNDGRVVHTWRSQRKMFCAYLLENGNLLRDGSDNVEAELFKTGGAAGYVELVSWDNEPIWSWSARPIRRFLTHHDLEPLPGGGCLVMLWERHTKEEALAVGRSPELIPDGEVWDNHVVELRPNGKGGADEVWTWKLWDHLCQDLNPDLPNYVSCPSQATHRFDINCCPVNGKQGCRDRTTIGKKGGASSHAPQGKTGEKDWIHANAVSYSAERDAVLISLNVPRELIMVDRQSGSIVWRWGSPMNWGGGTRLEQRLFCQHAAHFVEGAGGNRVLLFNNGRQPDRHWSSVDEIEIPTAAAGAVSTTGNLAWTFGPPAGRQGSFYCTHISSVQRLGNGNTLVLMGSQAIAFEVTPQGDEVFRYVCPVQTVNGGGAECDVRQGEQRAEGRYSLFTFRRYPTTYAAFAERDLTPCRHLEG